MDKSIISKFYLHDIATIALTLSSKIDEIDKKIKSFTGSILELKKKDGDLEFSIKENINSYAPAIVASVDNYIENLIANHKQNIKLNDNFASKAWEQSSMFLYDDVSNEAVIVDVPLANLARLNIAEFGIEEIAKKREKLVEIKNKLNTVVNKTTINIFDIVIGTAQKIEFIKEYCKLFANAKYKNGVVDKDSGRYIADEMETKKVTLQRKVINTYREMGSYQLVTEEDYEDYEEELEVPTGKKLVF